MALPETQTRLENRLLGRIGGGEPTLLVVAALHGNEPAGLVAAQRVLAALERDRHGLVGTLVAYTGNRKALAEGRRFLAEDLNRIWTGDLLAAAAAAGEGEGDAAHPERQELAELSRHLEELLATTPGDIYLLDLHTTSGPGPAFTVLDDTLANRRFARQLPVPVVLGLEEELEGTLASWMLSRGVVTAGFECGQHGDPESADRGEAAIWIGLEAAGALVPGSRPEPRRGRKLLSSGKERLPDVVETRYRHPVLPGDRFRPAPEIQSFERIEKGQTVAWDQRGPIAAPMGGRLLMPLFQSQGDDGFFIVSDVRPVWLEVSALLRRLRAERWLDWLPGVRRKPGTEDVFLVDRRVARWLARQIFHLLGYRRVGEAGSELEVSRRTLGRRPRQQR